MDKKFSLFPYVLLRIAGDSSKGFEQLQCRKTIQILKSIFQKEEELDDTKEKISEEIFTLISVTHQKNYREILIKLRRDIYNKRVVEYTIDDIGINVPTFLTEQINQYRKIHAEAQALYKSGEECYEYEVTNIKKKFLRLVRKRNFLKGILLSSDQIIHDIKKYIALKNYDNGNFSKLEKTLVKYLSRFYTKPTPFSTFTQLTVGHFDTSKKNTTILTSSGKKKKIKSNIQLNHTLFKYIFTLLIKNNKINAYIPLILNPSIRQTSTEYVFYTNYDSHTEAIQRVAISKAIVYIYSLLKRKSRWTKEMLVDKILSSGYIDATKDEVLIYIDKLIAYGFLEYNFGISWIDPLLASKFTKKLTSLPFTLPYIKKLVNVLTKLQKFSKEYETAAVGRRKVLLEKSFRLVRDICLQLHVAANLPEKERESFRNKNILINRGKNEKKQGNNNEVFTHIYDTRFTLQKKNIWYEDSYIVNNFFLSTKVKETLESLTTFFNKLTFFDFNIEIKIKTAYIFKKNYTIKQKVPLLNFYEKYLQEEKNIKNISKLKEIRQKKNKLLSSFMHSIKFQLRSSHTIRINFKHIEDFPIDKPLHQASFGSFLQICGSKGNPTIVINSVWTGFGKMFSRFLYFFGNKIINEINLVNKNLQRNALFAEIKDASTFNANIHPLIMPYEIVLPGGNAGVLQKNTIDIKDIEVCIDTAIEELFLFHTKLKKRIYAFDSGFGAEQTRSKFYTFLSSFAVSQLPNKHPFIDRINTSVRKKTNKDEIIILPEIFYENAIVQRKTWIVPKKVLPIREKEDTEWTYFLKLQSWREKNNIPEKVFVTLRDRNLFVEKNKQKIDHHTLVKHDDYKPQYISFSNPLLVALFEKMSNEVFETIKIQEMLPTQTEQQMTHNKKYAIEYFVQWN